MSSPSVRASTDAAQTAPACYVVVCRGPNCRERGGLPLRKRLAELLRHEPSVRLVGYACFGQCDFGPNVAFYPEGEWYGGLESGNAAEHIVRHAMTGEPIDAHRLSLQPSDRGEHLKNIGDLVRMLERDRSEKRHWWWPFS